MKKTNFVMLVLILSGCASHQYDGMQMKNFGDGVNYRLDEETLTVQYQEYQFIPDTTEVLMMCRNASKRIASQLQVLVKDFDYVTERNELLGITSCLAFGEIEQKN
ncbi:TPA: hypothetical protein ACN976_005213 [Vibrio campbellii]